MNKRPVQPIEIPDHIAAPRPGIDPSFATEPTPDPR